MRNYIILNGQNSQSIQGLLIQSLAPISKPQMRTQIEEIDGRNGDIVEELGFAAYDKQITIGLYGDYDVDEVVGYFNSKGTVIFSNEPEKYYNYQITDQIDFERLVRFKTATVSMHCQPFKYSTTEEAETLTVTENLLTIPNFTQTTNGVTVTATDGVISVEGTGSAATEFYVPIDSLTLSAGGYALNATSSGDNPNFCSLRLIGSAPSSADSFGGNYITLADGTVTLQATLAASKTFGYLWFYINAGTALDFTVTVEVEEVQASRSSDGSITNSGNIYSKPTLTVYGSGDVGIYANGVQMFQIALGDEGYITIDTEAMEAYKDTLNNLKNRLVTGDYNNFALQVGTNQITFSGGVTSCVIDKYSRWL